MKGHHTIAVFVFLCLTHGHSLGQASAGGNRGPGLPQGAYISLNPISLLDFIPSVATKEVIPYLHNLESGVSLAGGYYFPSCQIEGRIVAGSPSALVFCPQIHAGIRYFPFMEKKKGIPLGFGLFFRAWDTYYTHSGIHFFNLSPHINIGYVIRRKNVFFDLRLGWDVAVATWSNLEHSSPDFRFSYFPPALSLNIGYNFQAPMDAKKSSYKH